MLNARFRENSLFLSKSSRHLCAAILVSTCFANGAVSANQGAIFSQPGTSSLDGVRNTNGPAELAQCDFVIGDWDVDLIQYPREGAPVTAKARWRNVWIANGHVVMQEWWGPYVSGAELRAWDAEKEQWIGKNIYAGSNWRSTHAQFVDGKRLSTTRTP